MTQLNTPYPATAYLTGYLRTRGVDVAQADPALLWVLRLLSEEGIARIGSALPAVGAASVEFFRANASAIAKQVGPVVRFLQNRDLSLAHRIAGRRMLVEGPRFASIGPAGHEDEYLDWAFGAMGIVDRARYFATLFVEGIADAVREGIDPLFEFARYGEQLAMSQPTLEPLLAELEAGRARLTTTILDELTRDLLTTHTPDIVGMTLPFPGNVLGAMRMAETIRAVAPSTRIVWGGGYVNTELRRLSDPRLFDWVDAIAYDDGERPFERIIERFGGADVALVRTRVRENAQVVFHNDVAALDVPMKDTGTPTYDGLPLDAYLSLIDTLNPMHRLWSDTRWNKLTVAHGCYWRKCSFCDISLHYIQHYDPLAASLLVDRIEQLIAETGARGFHFVDEAAPPAALKALAEELLRRGVQIAWWGNVRFEKAFTPAVCELLARSGCIAVSGGLEVASNRLLGLMQKGVTVEQVARVTKAFGDAGVRVHAYLMYGFPTQTVQETVDALELVRQLFVAGCLDSAFWHRFAATVHAPVAKDPARFGITLPTRPEPTFAENDIPFTDPTGVNHDELGEGLRRALYNFMHGLALDEDIRQWFPIRVPRTTVKADFIAKALTTTAEPAKKAGRG
jgi:hypothetical protein